jgi:hypothetical protein
VLTAGVVDVPGTPPRDLTRDGRGHLDSVAVGVLDSLAPAVLDGATLVAPLTWKASGRVGTLTDKARTQATSTLPEWTRRYHDVLTPELRGDLATWRAATGVKPGDRSLAGPVPDDEREAAYHRRLVRTINARYCEALKVWETRIVDYVGRRDEHTTTLAKRLDELQRRGINAELMLDLASARKPLPADHPTSALAYRIRELATPSKIRQAPSIDPFPRSPQQGSGHSGRWHRSHGGSRT